MPNSPHQFHAVIFSSDEDHRSNKLEIAECTLLIGTVWNSQKDPDIQALLVRARHVSRKFNIHVIIKLNDIFTKINSTAIFKV